MNNTRKLNPDVHIICGKCGCSTMLEFQIKVDNSQQSSVNIFCNNCSTLTGLDEIIENKTKIPSQLPPTILNKQELLDRFKTSYTVGELKKFISEHNIPDTALILSQRITDFYFNINNWPVYLKKGFNFNQAKTFQQELLSGKYLDKEKYPNFNQDDYQIITDEQLKEIHEQYYPMSSCVFYNDEDNNDFLFIDSHY